MGNSIKLNLNEMRKTIFIPDRWVKFTQNNVTCVGITFLLDEANPDDPLFQLVQYISQERLTKTISFHECEDLRYLEFVKKPDRIKELKLNNKLISLGTQIDLLLFPKISRKIITTLTNNHSNQLFFN